MSRVFQFFSTSSTVYKMVLFITPYLDISLLRSVTVPELFRNIVMSAEVSRLLRIFDIKSGSMGGGPDMEVAEVIIIRLLRPPKLRPRSASVPLRVVSELCPKMQTLFDYIF